MTFLRRGTRQVTRRADESQLMDQTTNCCSLISSFGVRIKTSTIERNADEKKTVALRKMYEQDCISKVCHPQNCRRDPARHVHANVLWDA
eukprot:6211507-Pleurochrysis_carterae.AAC.1